MDICPISRKRLQDGKDDMRRIAYLTIVFSLAGCQQEEIPAKNSEHQVALAKVKDDIAGAHLQIALNRASAERQEQKAPG